jgi:hypothetical protein
MKTVLVNTFNNRGGAAAAALRLHNGLRLSGTDSRMLVRYKDINEDSISGIIVNNEQGAFSL